MATTSRDDLPPASASREGLPPASVSGGDLPPASASGGDLPTTSAPGDDPPTASASRDAMREAVLAWYDRVARDLPWRRTDDPYSILVSEVMLQQTQVSRVVPRFEAWIDRWPTAEALAAADRRDVLGAWVGLGYNSRAVRLQEACVVVARDGWPADARGLRALPGVGPYTAAAVASFAWGERVAAVDTNVVRISDRLGLGDPTALLPDDDRVATWNQAAMELGATVCRARVVACEACPAGAWCASAGRVVVPPRAARGSRERFEDSDRFVRGRIVAALTRDEELPTGIAPERLERAIAGLVRDGLVLRTVEGVVLAPGGEDRPE